MMKKHKIEIKGFTLIELLIVVAIIAILAGTVIMLLNPVERMQDAREASRQSHMASIGQAVHLVVIDCSDQATTTYCSDVEAVVNACQTAGGSYLLDADLANCLLDDELDNVLDPLTGEKYYIQHDTAGTHVHVWAHSSEST